MVNIFFGGWDAILRVVVVGALAYLALVVLLQSSGNRSLAQTRSFDFVVTVAIGATLGGVLTGRSVAIVEAIVAFGVLIGLQYLVTILQVRSEPLRRAVTQRPVLLAHQGEPLHDALRDHRLTLAELQDRRPPQGVRVARRGRSGRARGGRRDERRRHRQRRRRIGPGRSALTPGRRRPPLSRRTRHATAVEHRIRTSDGWLPVSHHHLAQRTLQNDDAAVHIVVAH